MKISRRNAAHTDFKKPLLLHSTKHTGASETAHAWTGSDSAMYTNININVNPILRGRGPICNRALHVSHKHHGTNSNRTCFPSQHHADRATPHECRSPDMQLFLSATTGTDFFFNALNLQPVTRVTRSLHSLSVGTFQDIYRRVVVRTRKESF